MLRRFLAATAAGAFAVATGATLTACNKRNFNADTRSNAAGASTAKSKTACVGMQGNGVRFPSHVGTFTALLEADILPVVAIGGSSGSIVGASVMGLIKNASVAKASATLNGRTPTMAQRAALVLSASPDVLNSFIFLPQVAPVDDFLASIVESMFGLLYGNALLGADDARIVSLEATVGQGVLMTDFFQHADFSSVYSLPTYEQRRRRVYDLWLDFADAKEVTIGQLLAAAAKSENERKADPALKDVSDRLYYMFSQDVALHGQTSESWKSVLEGVERVRRSGVLGKIDDKLNSIKLTVPNPKLVWNGYLSRTKDGRFLETPKGMVIHSTFRRGSYRTKNGTVDFTESSGIETLFQGYTASEPLFSDLLRAREKQASKGKGFLPYFADGAKTPSYAYPAERVLLLRNYEGSKPHEKGAFNEIHIPSEGDRLLKDGRRGLAHGIAYSAGEPGLFRRLPVYISKTEQQDNPAILDLSDESAADPKEGMISFGGWSEHVPTSTLALLDACKDVDYYVSGAKAGLGDMFQEAAIRASLRGFDAITHRNRDRLYEFFFNRLPKGEEAVKAHFAALKGNVEFSRVSIKEEWISTGEAKAKFLNNDLDFDAPAEASGIDDKTRKALNGKLSNNRFALMIASYQRFRRNMPQDSNLPKFNSFGRDLSGDAELVAKRKSPTEVEDYLSTIR